MKTQRHRMYPGPDVLHSPQVWTQNPSRGLKSSNTHRYVTGITHYWTTHRQTTLTLEFSRGSSWINGRAEAAFVIPENNVISRHRLAQYVSDYVRTSLASKQAISLATKRIKASEPAISTWQTLQVARTKLESHSKGMWQESWNNGSKGSSFYRSHIPTANESQKVWGPTRKEQVLMTWVRCDQLRFNFNLFKQGKRPTSCVTSAKTGKM